MEEHYQCENYTELIFARITLLDNYKLAKIPIGCVYLYSNPRVS